MIKYLALIIFAMSVLLISPTEVSASCLNINVSMPSFSNWPGGDIEIACHGGQDVGFTNPDCQGDSTSISPGETKTLTNCDCKFTGQGCFYIKNTPSNISNSCTIEPPADRCGGQNGSDSDIALNGSCRPSESPPGGGNPGGGNPGEGGQNPPGGGNPGGGNPGEEEEEEEANECTYDEVCIENGQEGSRTCDGRANENGCGFSENRNANCSECRPGETPQNPPENPPPPTNPTPVPPINRCNQPCESDAYCAETTGDNCTQCLPSTNGKTCQPPPGVPPKTNPPAKTPSPTVRPTATPLAYSPVMCKCDGLTPSLIVPGLTSQITAKAYVGGADTKLARIKDVVFTLVEGNNTVGKVLARSAKIEATTSSITTNRVNYAATWNVDIPSNLTKGSIYRIFATINCEKKKVVALDMLNTAVLGEETVAENQGLLAGVTDWFKSLFGDSTTPQPTATPNPTAAAQNPQQNLGGNEELKLRTVQPAIIMNKSCTSMTFQAK